MIVKQNLVRTRERIIDGVLGIGWGEALNGMGTCRPAGEGDGIVDELAAALRALKGLAFDDDGRRVDYQTIKASREYAAYRLLCSERLPGLDLTSIRSREARLAFWINLYNLLVIDAVLWFGVRDTVAEGWGGQLRFFRKAAYIVGGHRFSCDDIEHGILRANRGHPFIPGPQFAASDPRSAFVVEPVDPRIHFALNCASKACPPISAYDERQVDAQLEMATRSFVLQEVDVRVDPGEVRLPLLFRWYRVDFGGEPGILEFLGRYLDGEEDRAWLRVTRGRLRIVYQSYDWSLNGAAADRPGLA